MGEDSHRLACAACDVSHAELRRTLERRAARLAKCLLRHLPRYQHCISLEPARILSLLRRCLLRAVGSRRAFKVQTTSPSSQLSIAYRLAELMKLLDLSLMLGNTETDIGFTTSSVLRAGAP